jgi:tRNA threonylcarbamoyladenosine biosynthesis protein TsaE
MPTLTLTGEAATAALAGRIAAIARVGDVIALDGDLGTGKSVFARAFIQHRIKDADEVPSPTFTLVQTYVSDDPSAPAIYHFDLFRIKNANEAFELGIEEAFASGISLIEWPERLGSLLPVSALLIELAHGDETEERRCRIAGDASWQPRLREAGLV